MTAAGNGRPPGEDPAVLSWRIALSPRPRFTTGGRHWWREYVTEMFHAARDSRQALRESGRPAPASIAGAAGSGVGYYQLSDQEFDQAHPPPRFRDFLVDLSHGGTEPPW